MSNQFALLKAGGAPLFVAADHAGFAGKQRIFDFLKSNGIEVTDLGAKSEDSVDYPDFAHQLASKLKENPDAFGLLVCGSGQGMAMTANKHAHIRAALCWSKESAELSRQHNNANVLCVGARLLDIELIKEIVEVFFSTEFEGGRHQRRVDKMRGAE